MQYRVTVNELHPESEGEQPVEHEVYRQTVEDLNIPALVELVNVDERRRVRWREEQRTKRWAS